MTESPRQPDATTPTVLVFDSGAGGLSICTKIMALRNDCAIVYAADNAYFPYGELSTSALRQRVITFMGELIDQYSPSIAVIACNTASTALLADLRETFDIPFVGVVPAIKPAATATQTGTIAILATSATVTRDYTRDLINEFAPNKTVILHSAQQLVSAAEQLIQNNQCPDTAIQDTLSELFAKPGAKHIDTIVLACTHFPLLREAIQAQLPASITLLDSGDAIARRVNSLLFATNALKHTQCFSVHLSKPCTTTLNAYNNFLAAHIQH